MSTTKTRTRRAVWVGMFRDRHVALEVQRVTRTRVVARVVEPGHEFEGVVSDFHPADVVLGAGE